MKPAKFEYAAPDGVEQALALLSAGGPDARLLAGGQSLMPAMNFRLAKPSLLVDLRRIAGLRGLRLLDDGSIVAGAMTRHRDVEMSPLIRDRLPLLHAAMPGIAHLPIRSRGTIGGSLAHADPAADWPALCMACDAVLTLRSATGTRTVKSEDFSLGFFSTALAPAEILTEVRFPAWPARQRWGLQKFARRRGDFAIVGVIAVVWPGETTIVVYGAGDRPLKIALKEKPSAALFVETARKAADAVPARSDLHASGAYRKELVEVLTRRALEQAFR